MTLPDKLTAAEFERLKAQEQRMLNSGSWVPQAEDIYAAELNAKATKDSAPATMTAQQADAAEAQQSVEAETQFGKAMGARPDYWSGPAINPADSEPKTIEELRRKQQELYHDPSYDMTFDEWKDYTQWQRENEGAVTGFFKGLSGAPAMLGQLGAGLVKERAQQAMRATVGRDPIGAATAEVATFKEMGRKIGVGLTQLTDWAGGKINDIVASGRRVGQMQANIVQALRDSGKLTGDPIQDNTTIQQAIDEAAAQGMFEPTHQQVEEDDETGYQRYQRNQAYQREYMGVTQYSIGGTPVTLPDVKKTATNPVTGQVEQPMETTATVGAMALSPENFIPVGVGALSKVRMLRRFASLTGKAFKLGEEGAAALDGMMMRGADRLTSKLPLVGDLSLNKRMAALGGIGAGAAYLDSQTDSPIVDVIAKPLIVAGAFLPTVKASGATLRKAGSASGATWQVIKEMDAGAMGTMRAETAARMAKSGKFNPRYAKYMERGAEGGVESTLRRVSNNADMPETLRKMARSADGIGITQLARGVDDVVSSAAVAGLAATPFALVAPDSETAGGIVGGALLLGGTTGAAGRVIGRRSSRTDADIARMMVDVEMAGGDAGSLGALSYSGLDMLSAMQGITSGKVDFIPLRAQEYRANADVRANGGETTAGLHIEQATDGRAKVYVNMGHAAPVAGRVSIRAVENGNVVRIKGKDGESDFTFVPNEYPLLVKSGDFVEPNAHLARGLSPTHVLPHEIGHAILTSNILNGTVRDDLRNLVNQRYDTPGVELRGREYVTRLVDKDIMAGAHDQLPDKLTQQEFDDISSGRKTLADVLKGKPVSETQRAKMIDDRYQEMRERSIAQGDNPDGLDVFRDEIVAETFNSLSDGIDFRRMRTGGPQVMESVLAATTRVFETLGMAFDKSTGKPLDNPSVIFRDNPLMKDPVMRKRMQEHLRNYEAWMVGMEQAGAREQKGTQISVDGSAESARRSTHTRLRANENGILENDLIFVDQNGIAQWKPQGVLDQQERGRSAQVGQLYDKNKIVAPNSAQFGLRRTGGGRTIISGPTLPAKFDVLRWFPKHVREMARMLEGSRDRGASHIFNYNTIGTGEGGRYRVINRGDVRAILREGAFLGWEATKAGHLKAVIMDLNAFRSAAMKAINKGELAVFNNDMAQVHADLLVYLSNHKNGLPGEATIGQQKRDMLNGLIGTGTAVQRDINPLHTDLNPRGSVRTFRIDRVNDITPTGRDGYHFDYDKIKNNRMPQQIPREAQGMPDAVETLTTDQLQRQYEENQGYLGLSTLGMREGRPVRGGAAQTRELLRRNEAITAELERRGYKGEDEQLQRALQRRGQAMPDAQPAEVRQDGTVVAPEDAPTFTLPRRAMARFMPDTGINLEDYADRPIVALPADRMGIGQMRVGPKGAEQILSVPGQGGAGFMEIYNGGGWAFTDTATADRFLGRLREVARPGDTSVIVGITALNEVNHLKNQTGQLAYVEALEAAIKNKSISRKQADAHIREIAKRIYTSEASPKALTQSTRDKFKAMRSFDDFQKAVRAKSLNFADAAWLLDKMQQRTLPVPYKEARDIGIAFDDVARQTADPRYADVPFGTVVALLEVPINQAPSKNPFHYAYPAKVEGNRIGFLSKFQNIDDLTGDPRIRNKQGRVTAQPLQTVLPVMDRIGQPARAQFMPDADPISAAAVREQDGSIFTGPLHTTAIEKAMEAGYKSGGYAEEDYGFVTKGGRFLSSQQARDYAIAQGQVTRQGIDKWERELGIDGMPGLESGAFALAKSEAKKFKRFDEDFAKAVAREDKDAARKINDQAAKELGLKPVIHATSAEPFAEFKIHPEGDIQHGFPAIFFSDKDMGFGRHRDAKGKRRVEAFYIRMERPLDLRKYKSNTEHPAYQKAYDQYGKVFEKAIEQGRVTEDSVVLGPLLDELPFDSLLLDEAQGFSYAVLDPSQIVPAEPILRDASGAAILPSQRFASALATKNTIARQANK